MYVHDNKTNRSNDVTENPLNEWGFQGVPGVTRELQGFPMGFWRFLIGFRGFPRGFRWLLCLWIDILKI